MTDTLRTQRDLPYPPQQVFAAFTNAQQLATWWGPSGFRNTFSTFEFETGGRWIFTMHGPNGQDYANESVFEQIVPNQRVVIRHVCQPHFTLTIELAAIPSGTRLNWAQKFESAEVCEQLSAICIPANEQNLDRLTAVLAAS